MKAPSLQLFLAFAYAIACGRGAPPPPRHLMLVSIDTLRADHLGPYGQTRVQTPNFDALARESILFEAHVNPAPTTLNSHTSLMTGLWPHSHGVPRNGFVLSDRNRMLAEVLADAGWRTAGFIGAYPLSRRFNFHQGFQHWDEEFAVEEGGSGERRNAEAVNRAVFDWLDANPLDPDERLFLFVHYFDVHAPFIQPEPFDGMYRDDDSPIRGSIQEVYRLRAALAGRRPGARRDSRAMAAQYATGVTYVDHALGALVAGLEARGLYREALFVVTSDHGETHDEHVREEPWNHGATVYETAVHTPLLLRRPDGAGEGRRVPQPVSGVDVMPTLLDLIGVAAPEGVEGRSLAPLLEGEGPAGSVPLFAEASKPYTPGFERPGAWRNLRKVRAAREGRYKLIYMPAIDHERLFDVEADPAERVDLLSREPVDPEHREIADRLRAALDRWDAAAKLETARRDVSEESERRLRALGYVDEGSESGGVPTPSP